MRDLKSTRAIWHKGWLFLFLGVASSTLLILESPSLKVAALLSLAVWSFCRAYYFAFYVIQHYVDGSYKFSGLTSFCQYLFRRRNQ